MTFKTLTSRQLIQYAPQLHSGRPSSSPLFPPLAFFGQYGIYATRQGRRREKRRKEKGRHGPWIIFSPLLSLSISLRRSRSLFELGSSIIGRWLMMKNDFGLKPFTHSSHTHNFLCMCVCVSHPLSLSLFISFACCLSMWMSERDSFFISGHFGQTVITSASVLHNGTHSSILHASFCVREGTDITTPVSKQL